jgi:phosphate uptake regulator/aminoglycoside phosphotransferase
MIEVLSHGGVDENLRFLIIEVSRQIERTHGYLENPSTEMLESILRRDDYIDHLRNVVHRLCFELVAERTDNEAAVDVLKNIEIVATNLERIADFCVNIVRQASFIEDEAVLECYSLVTYFNEVYGGLSFVTDGIFNLDTNLALRLCRTEDDLDKLYADDLSRIIEQLKTGSGRDAPSLVTCMFILHYLERMGDSLLNIGEAILSAKLGERIKIGQLRILEDSLASANISPSLSTLNLARIADTRSGTRIDRVTRRGGENDEQMMVFKEGQRHKLLEEREGIARWDELMPGIAPAVYAFNEHGDTGALLFEFLQGQTFEHLVLNAGPRLMETAFERLAETLTYIWNTTRNNTPLNAGYTRQLARRLDEVYALHPDFRGQDGAIGTLKLESFDSLLERARALEQQLPAPFSVLIHGDFNVDNIIYDPDADRVRFIDLHRSEMQDYVQDISVFLVSNHRLQVFDTPVRRRINAAITSFHGFASDYAASVGDATFQARLALGLARSFATSARFVLDKGFARSLFMRARFLLEQITAVDYGAIANFRLKTEVLVD